MSSFDRYVVIDWSARNAPATGPDSIWIATCGRHDSIELSNPSTRRTAERSLVEMLERHRTEHTLVAIDVGLGYPVGTARWFGLGGGTPWRQIWDVIADAVLDDERNRNNRFEVAAELNRRTGDAGGPFWGCPTDALVPHLTRTKPATPPAVGEYRHTERRLRATGRHPKSMWQLLGAGSVGGQSLTAIPMLRRLLTTGVIEPVPRFDVEVWTFTTGLTAPHLPADIGVVVVAEVWPSQFVDVVPEGIVKDAAQVRGVAAALRDADRSGELIDWLQPDVDERVRTDVVAHEGWVLGPPG